MGKRVIGTVLAILTAVSVLTGCGAGSSNVTAAETAASSSAATAPADIKFGGEQDTQQHAISGYATSDGGAEAKPAAAEGASSVLGGGGTDVEAVNAILNERKMIRSANVTVEVENFDEAYGKLNNFILGIGFIQETNINSEKVYVDNRQKLVKSGSIVMRVDKNKFDSILNNVKGIGDVYNWNINGQDVTDKYIDVESRLRLLKLEEGKLEDYLKKISDLDQIFKIENQLTDIRQEIESLTGNLKKMSDLVELSTITVNMRERYPGQAGPVEPVTYGQRLLTNFTDSLKGVAHFLGELAIVLMAALPVLIILGLFTAAVLFIYRRVLKRRRPGPGTALDNPDAGRENKT